MSGYFSDLYWHTNVKFGASKSQQIDTSAIAKEVLESFVKDIEFWFNEKTMSIELTAMEKEWTGETFRTSSLEGVLLKVLRVSKDYSDKQDFLAKRDAMANGLEEIAKKIRSKR